MIQLERHERILAYLTTHRFMGVEQAHILLEASPATIRRDFNDLAERGLAQRTRGGLRRLDQVEDGALPYAFRAGRYSVEKSCIARHAMGFLQPGDVVFVDGGTTTHHIVSYLPAFPLTLITNSLRLAATLGERSPQVDNVRVLLSGGVLHPEAGLLVGPQATRTLSEYHADWAFISPSGVDSHGIYNTNEDAAASERVMIQNARQTAVLADPGKFGKTSLCRITGLAAIERLVTTQASLSEALQQQLQEDGVQLEQIAVDS